VTSGDTRDENAGPAASVVLEVGQVVATRYRLERKIGEGGMGVVWEAVHLVTRRPVALKFLKRASTDDGAARQRFLREARATSALSHPGLVAVHDVLELDDGSLCMVMDLMRGESLGDKLTREGALWLPEVARIMARACAAVAAAHAVGVVHRDLKPDNIFLAADSEGGTTVKVLDFGIAKLAARPDDAPVSTRTTDANTVVGTPLYMAPEQLFGDKALDHRADLWAIGVILYEALTGAPPTKADTVGQVVRLVARGELLPLGARAPNLPQPIIALVDRLLRYDRNERPNDLQEVIATLSAYAEAPSGQLPQVAASRPSRGPVDSYEARAPTLDSASMPQLPQPTPTTRPRPAPRQTPGWRWLWLASLPSLTVASLGAWFILHHLVPAGVPSPHVAPSAAASSATGADPGPTTLADLPLPATDVPEALVEYRAGLQLQRDDNYGNATRRFQHAAELDPAMALAHLRVAVAGGSLAGAELVRAEFAKANALRAALGERDRALMDALEPVLGRSDPDEGAAIERLRRARERYPRDEEFALNLAFYTIGDPVHGPTAAREAIALDPLDACAWETLGRALVVAGDITEARRSLERCSSISTESADCFGWLALLDGEAGRCAEMERDARRAVDQDARGGSLRLAAASVAVGRPRAAITETIARFVSTSPPGGQPVDQARYDALLAALDGQFDLALRRLDDAGRALAAAPNAGRNLRANGDLAATRIRLLSEIGDAAGARTAAREFSDRLDLLSVQANAAGRGIGRYLWVVERAGLPLDPRRHDEPDFQ